MSNLALDVYDWSAPTSGTTDYFNSCSEVMGMPRNFAGQQAVKFGRGYVGFYLKAPNNYREYIQGALSQTLERGKRYGLSFYISLSESSKYGVSEINAFFSEHQIQRGGSKFLLLQDLGQDQEVMNLSAISDYRYYLDTEAWVRLETEFIAEGRENFLTIGNFHNDAHTKLRRSIGTKEMAYYYLDMVSVTKIDAEQDFDQLVLDRTYTLRDVKFDTDSYALTGHSKRILDRLYARLTEEKGSFLTISAHTDDQGSDAYNLELSVNRAKSISKYLVAKGYPKHRIEWVGHGESRPKTTNGTTTGRQLNRRAEFKLSKLPFGTVTGIARGVFEDIEN